MAGFNYEDYKQANPELATMSDADLLVHYAYFGFSELRLVSFNSTEYLEANPGLPQSWDYNTALSHYNIYGKNEHRPLAFDKDAYLAANPGLPQNWDYNTALGHWNVYGKNEGRLLYFSLSDYLAANPNLPQNWTEAEAIGHWQNYGKYEHRLLEFNGEAYLQLNPGLETAGFTAANAVEHYLLCGMSEGRSYYHDYTYNQSPVTEAGNNTTGQAGQAIDISTSNGLSILDYNNDIVTLTFSDNGAGGTFNITSLTDTPKLLAQSLTQLTYTPAQSAAGTDVTITITADDQIGAPASDSFTLSVTQQGGSTQYLTTMCDFLTGTSGNDTFIASLLNQASDTLQDCDIIAGEGGTDILKLDLAANYSGSATISGVEEIQITAFGSSEFNAGGVNALNILSIGGSSQGNQSITNLDDGVTVGIGHASQSFDDGYDLSVSMANDTFDDVLNYFVDNSTSNYTYAVLKSSDIERVNIEVDDSTSNPASTNIAQTEADSVTITGGTSGTLLGLGSSSPNTYRVDATNFEGSISMGFGNDTLDQNTFIYGGKASADSILAYYESVEEVTLMTSGVETIGFGVDISSGPIVAAEAFTINAANMSGVETIALGDGYESGSYHTFYLNNIQNGTHIALGLDAMNMTLEGPDNSFVTMDLNFGVLNTLNVDVNALDREHIMNINNVDQINVSVAAGQSTIFIEGDCTTGISTYISSKVSGGAASDTFRYGVSSKTTELDATSYEGDFQMVWRNGTTSPALTATTGNGNDTIIMANTGDQLDAGAGIDTLEMDTRAGSSVVVDLYNSTNQITTVDNAYVGAVAQNFESVNLTEMTNGCTVTGNDSENTISSGKGDDLFIIYENVDSKDTIVLQNAASNGMDTVRGFETYQGLDLLKLQDTDTTCNTSAGQDAVLNEGASGGASNGADYLISGQFASLTGTTDVLTLSSSYLPNLANAQLSGNSYGFELFKALCSNTGSSDSIANIQVDTAGDKFFILAYDGTNACLFHCDSGADNLVSAMETSLVGVFENITDNGFYSGDIAMS